MVYAANLGYPRIGKKRQLKKALEAFWSGAIQEESLLESCRALRADNWKVQSEKGIDFIPSNDFSMYDHVLDTIAMAGAVPKRFGWNGKTVDLRTYFTMARGLIKVDESNGNSLQTRAMEMTKWFNTNYHIIVPEITDDQQFRPATKKCLDEFLEAKELGYLTRPVLLGPVSFLLLSKGYSSNRRKLLLERLLEVYRAIFDQLSEAGCQWIQIDEPFLSMDLDRETRDLFRLSYEKLSQCKLAIMLTSYFAEIGDNLPWVINLPIHGIHLDLINGKKDLDAIYKYLPDATFLSAGVVDGRNVWRADLTKTISALEDIAEKIGPERLIVSPSCSLLHVPLDVELETSMNEEVKSWLAFAEQKLDEVSIVTDALCIGLREIQSALHENRQVIAWRKTSEIRNDPAVEKRLKTISSSMTRRRSNYAERFLAQKRELELPLLPTTTIGSFPQTKDIREARKKYRSGEFSKADYELAMQKEIETNIGLQEKIGLDVFVHGEPERTDMVEYFSEMLQGFTSTQQGWVQSYGSRYVKPPILYGNVSRPKAMTVDWAVFAQRLSEKPVKGMLTGPVTILQWSFVRDDQSREKTCTEIALAIRDEVEDLEKAGIRVIQIDEPAIREGLPIRKRAWADYLRWAVDCFRLATCSVKDETQIHTHMCYSEFGDMVDDIARMDADVISIEAARSQMDLLEFLREKEYPNSIGPGVYDIHSPRVPSDDEIDDLIMKALQVIPIDRLWINPDCGLKTRDWREVVPSLNALAQSAMRLRKEAGKTSWRFGTITPKKDLSKP